MNFRIILTVLYQFLETETSDIIFMGHDQELKWLESAYTPFHFSFTVPLKGKNIKNLNVFFQINQVFPFHDIFIQQDNISIIICFAVLNSF